MPRSRLLLAVLLLAMALPGAARSEDVLPAQVIVRKFPQGVFCALPVSLTFVAPASPVVVTFTAVEFVDDGFGTVNWTEQAIDNVSIATTAQVVANTSGPPAGSNLESCYIGDPQPVEYFHFNHPGLTFARLDRFDTDPAANGWSLGAGGYFSGRTAPRDVDNDTDVTGGSLGLGDGTGPAVDGSLASASVLVDNLTPGVSYDLGAWWFANFVRFPYAQYLTINVTTDSGTPVARRSWGSVKASGR